MSYAVKEIFFTLQGEGINAGRPAVFCRFSGCNLWTGKDSDRSRGLGGCSLWCDTDFVGTNGTRGGKYASASELADEVAAVWPAECGARGRKFVVCTGGEPALQLDSSLIGEFRARGFEVAIETNGTRPLADGIDWICLSPKFGTEIVVRHGSELKFVYPQQGLTPEEFVDWNFEHFVLQPLDSSASVENTAAAVSYCLANPQWRLSLQSHKILGLR
jgi:7-carboxy-7-deazaguanine synthase